MTAARAVLCLLSLVLPVALWTGSTSYDAAKYLAWALAAVAWLALAAGAVARGRGFVPPSRRLVAAGATMLLVQLPGLWLAGSPHLAARALLWSALWWLVVLVAAQALRDDRRRQRLAVCAAVGAAGTGAIALLQLAGALPAPSEWYIPRGIGTLGNANAVAELAATWLVPSLLLPLAARNGGRRSLALLPTIVLLATLVTTDATGARLAALAAIVFTAAGEALLRSRWAARAPVVLGALALAGSLAAILLVDQAQTGGSLVARESSLPARVLAANHGAERRADWLVAREQWRSRPLTGCGAGNYGVAWPATRAGLAAAGGFPAPAGGAPVATRAHNEYLQWAAETGWLGVAWLVVVAVAGALAWARAWRAATSRTARRGLLLPAAGLVAGAVTALVAFPAHQPASGLALALLAGLLAAAATSAPAVAVRCPRWGALPAAAAALLLLAGAVRIFSGDLLLERGARLHTAGDMSAAIAPLQAGLARVPWPGTARLQLGLALAATGRAGEAGAMLERSLRDRPSFEAPLTLAELEIDAGRPARAAAWLDLAERCAPPRPQAQHAAYLRAYALLRAGDLQAARAGFAAQVADDRLDHRAWLALGYVADLRGERDAAIAAYRQAVAALDASLAAPRPATAAARGEVARLRGHLEAARRALAAVGG